MCQGSETTGHGVQQVVYNTKTHLTLHPGQDVIFNKFMIGANHNAEWLSELHIVQVRNGVPMYTDISASMYIWSW